MDHYHGEGFVLERSHEDAPFRDFLPSLISFGTLDESDGMEEVWYILGRALIGGKGATLDLIEMIISINLKYNT